ncbi:MAG: hypothetical protein K6E69_05905, partial [Treponema sp.]|nr:hypothetical protein [Treponema sp.]
ELVVKVKNCSDSRSLPISRNCDILKQYCQFVEIVEQTFNKRSPRRSFKKAIDIAISKGILSDYLNRKTREVINMLCAKYDYKMDIAVKKEEAFQDGKEAGAQQKAIEDAVIAVTKFHVPIDDVAREYNIDKELIESNLNP